MRASEIKSFIINRTADRDLSTKDVGDLAEKLKDEGGLRRAEAESVFEVLNSLQRVSLSGESALKQISDGPFAAALSELVNAGGLKAAAERNPDGSATVKFSSLFRNSASRPAYAVERSGSTLTVTLGGVSTGRFGAQVLTNFEKQFDIKDLIPAQSYTLRFVDVGGNAVGSVALKPSAPSPSTGVPPDSQPHALLKEGDDYVITVRDHGSGRFVSRLPDSYLTGRGHPTLGLPKASYGKEFGETAYVWETEGKPGHHEFQWEESRWSGGREGGSLHESTQHDSFDVLPRSSNLSEIGD